MFWILKKNVQKR